MVFLPKISYNKNKYIAFETKKLMNPIPLTILTLPIWWYTTGLSLFWKWFDRKFWYHLHRTNLITFAKHWREPLYGDYTKSGKIIGGVLRIIIIFYKAINFFVRIIFLSLALIAYMFILPLVLIIIFYQIFGIHDSI